MPDPVAGRKSADPVHRCARWVTVLPIHHAGKDKTTIRGPSALEAGVDTVYQTEGDHTGITLKRTKRKDGPPDDVHQLRLETVLDSGVMSRNATGLTTREAEVLSSFESSFSSTGATGTQLREVLLDMPKSTFYAALNALITAGSLRNEGTRQRPFYRLAGEDHDAESSSPAKSKAQFGSPVQCPRL